jgi:hypothetical protein
MPWANGVRFILLQTTKLLDNQSANDANGTIKPPKGEASASIILSTSVTHVADASPLHSHVQKDANGMIKPSKGEASAGIILSTSVTHEADASPLLSHV